MPKYYFFLLLVFSLISMLSYAQESDCHNVRIYVTPSLDVAKKDSSDQIVYLNMSEDGNFYLVDEELIINESTSQIIVISENIELFDSGRFKLSVSDKGVSLGKEPKTMCISGIDHINLKFQDKTVDVIKLLISYEK